MAELQETLVTQDERAARDAAECSSCKAPIYWVRLPSGKKMPIDRGRESRVVYAEGEWRVLGSYKSHFASCPDGARWRKK